MNIYNLIILTDRMKLLQNWKERVPFDGLNTLNYTVLSREFQRLVTIVHVKVKGVPVRRIFSLLSHSNNTPLQNIGTSIIVNTDRLASTTL